jgi:hypothetical protein
MKKVLIFGALLALVFSFAGVAKADTVTIDGVQFSGTVTSTDVTLTVTCTESSCANYAIGSISLKGFSDSGMVSNITEPPGYSVQAGGQNNGGTTNCNGTQTMSAVCWDASGAFISIGSGLSFDAKISGGSPGTLHVQTVIFSDSTGSTRITGVSNDLNGTSVATPEPASLMLLGLGLVGVPFLRRRK